MSQFNCIIHFIVSNFNLCIFQVALKITFKANKLRIFYVDIIFHIFPTDMRTVELDLMSSTNFPYICLLYCNLALFPVLLKFQDSLYFPNETQNKDSLHHSFILQNFPTITADTQGKSALLWPENTEMRHWRLIERRKNGNAALFDD